MITVAPARASPVATARPKKKDFIETALSTRAITQSQLDYLLFLQKSDAQLLCRVLVAKAYADAGHACRHPDRKDHKNKDAARLDARIAKLRQECNRLSGAALKAAHVLGDNPYPGVEAAELWDHQQNLTHHTSADWGTQTREEVEGRVPPTFKDWLLRVRGY